MLGRWRDGSVSSARVKQLSFNLSISRVTFPALCSTWLTCSSVISMIFKEQNTPWGTAHHLLGRAISQIDSQSSSMYFNRYVKFNTVVRFDALVRIHIIVQSFEPSSPVVCRYLDYALEAFISPAQTSRKSVSSLFCKHRTPLIGWVTFRVQGLQGLQGYSGKR